MSSPGSDDEPRPESAGSELQPSEPQPLPPSSQDLAAALRVVEQELAARPSVPLGAQSTEVLAISETTVGPMPSAREMAGYKNVDATLPARVADGADDERQHRHALEARQSKTEAFVSIVGVLGGVLFVVLMVALAAFPWFKAALASPSLRRYRRWFPWQSRW